MLQYPDLLKILTWAVLKWELYGSFFFISPFFTDQLRFFGAMGYILQFILFFLNLCLQLIFIFNNSFFGMHLGFVLCMRLGFFFYVCAAGYILFHFFFFFIITSFFLLIICYSTFILWPPLVWDYLFSKLRTPERKAFSIYFNESSPFSKLLSHLLHTFFLLPETSVHSLISLSESGVFPELYTSRRDGIIIFLFFSFLSLLFFCSLFFLFFLLFFLLLLTVVYLNRNMACSRRFKGKQIQK